MYTPPECTDVVSPCDHHVGAELKRLMKIFFQADYEVNFAAWNNATLSASSRRQKMASWGAAAWAILREETELLKSAFVSTGFLINRNGTENHLIKLRGALVMISRHD